MELTEPAASIAKLGFRKWYERQLIDGHLALVTCILSGFLAAAALEAFTGPDSMAGHLAWLGVFVVASAVTWKAWRRYQHLMQSAWRLGERAVCGGCTAYGRFKVDAGGAHPRSGPWLDVQCRKCGFKWRMPD